MAGIAVGMLLGLAGFLVVSAAAKVSAPSVATAALNELGLPSRVARFSVVAAVTAEAATATAIMLWPHAFMAEAACIALFGAFALVAGLALHNGRPLECGCQGSLRRSTLGWTQVLQFVAVVPTVVVVGQFTPVWTVQTGLGLLIVAQVVVSGLLLAYASQIWWQVMTLAALAGLGQVASP